MVKVLRDTLHFDSKTESSGIAEVADIRRWLQKGYDDRWRTSLVRLVSTLSIRPGLQRRQATWRRPWKTMVKMSWRIQKERLFLLFIEWYIVSCDTRNNAVVSCRLIVRILCRIKKQLRPTLLIIRALARCAASRGPHINDSDSQATRKLIFFRRCNG